LITVTNIAGEAISIVVIGLALVVYDLTNTVVVDVTLRALEANLIVPVPFTASDLRRTSDGCQSTLSVLNAVSIVAGQTVSEIIVSFTLAVNNLADSVIVEVSLRALKADLVIPVPFTASDLSRSSNWC
jgi:hypothetical protein